MPADPSALITESSCFNSCIPPGMQMAVMNYLLYLILLNGGGGGGSAILWTYWEASHANDNPPIDPTKAVQRRFLNGDTPVTWNPDSNQWV